MVYSYNITSNFTIYYNTSIRYHCYVCVYIYSTHTNMYYIYIINIHNVNNIQYREQHPPTLPFIGWSLHIKMDPAWRKGIPQKEATKTSKSWTHGENIIALPGKSGNTRIGIWIGGYYTVYCLNWPTCRKNRSLFGHDTSIHLTP